MTTGVSVSNRIGTNADRVGLGAMLVAAICLVALGAKWVSGAASSVVLLLLLLALIGVFVLALRGRRHLHKKNTHETLPQTERNA